MRHSKHKHQLGVTKAHRHALMANLAASLIRHSQITTTLAKAKALRPFIEKNITLAKQAKLADNPAKSLHYRRLAIARIRDKDAVKLLFNEKVEEFVDRKGGYTRIYKLGKRVGDAAEMAIIQFVPADDEGYKKRKKAKSTKKAQPKAKATSKAKTEDAPKAEVAEEKPAKAEAEKVEEAKQEVTEEKAEAKTEAKEPKKQKAKPAAAKKAKSTAKKAEESEEAEGKAE